MSLFKSQKSLEIEDNWATLTSLEKAGYLSFLDLAIAKELLKDFDEQNEALAALICHLSLASRNGHLCVQIEGQTIFPDPFTSWSENCISEKGEIPSEHSKEQLKTIFSMILQAFNSVPSSLVTLMHSNSEIYDAKTPLCKVGSYLYFHRYWYYETLFLKNFHKFVNHQPAILLERDKINYCLQGLSIARDLLPEQISAILNSCNTTLTIICGGPGTGKTFTAGVLICALWDSLTETQKEKFEISLAAPTGKAAANLQKSLLKAAQGIDKLLSLQAKTLHALLGIKGSMGKSEILPLGSDLVIVDECSMIDVKMMGALFASLKPGARLILLGDPHQLPAVESGSLFSDLVRNDNSSSVNQLKKCLRAELQGIIEVASAINSGDEEKTLELFENPTNQSGVSRYLMDPNLKSQSAKARELSKFGFNCFKMSNLEHLQPSELLEHFNAFRMLSPLRKGSFGIEEMNYLVGNEYRNFLAQTNNKKFIAPIILLKNDYSKDLFNGEVGVLVKPNYKSSNEEFEISLGDYALFSSKEGDIRKIPALLLPTFEFAYCLSVHKSQGSEFDHVMLLLPTGSECFGRELLYTAVTRARRHLTLWADNDTLNKTLQKTNYRLSGLPHRL